MTQMLQSLGTGDMIAIVVFAALAMCTLLVVTLGTNKTQGEIIAGRLKAVSMTRRVREENRLEAEGLVRKGKFRSQDSFLGRIERRLNAIGGAKMTRYIVLGGIVVGALSFVIASMLVQAGPVISIAVAVAGTIGGMIWAYMMLVEKRVTAFLAAFPEAIDLVVRSVRAGIPVNEAILVAGKEVNEPVRGEFRRIAEEVTIGLDLEEALTNASDRIQIPDFKFFVVTLVLQRETGGQLAETLSNLSDIIRKRKEMRLKIKAITSEGRTSTKIVGSIPFLTTGALFLLNPKYLMVLFETDTGRIFLMIGLGLLATGITIINRLVKMET